MTPAIAQSSHESHHPQGCLAFVYEGALATSTVIPRSMTDCFHSLQNVSMEYGRAAASRPNLRYWQATTGFIAHDHLSYSHTLELTAFSSPLPLCTVEECICGELSCLTLQILMLLRGHHSPSQTQSRCNHSHSHKHQNRPKDTPPTIPIPSTDGARREESGKAKK